MEFKIQISDRAFALRQEIQDRARNIQWDYNRLGGCGSFSFEIPERFCQEIALGGFFNVKILGRHPSTGTWTTWYQGRIENKTHNVRGDNETIRIQGTGYQSQLKDIYVDATYTSKTIEYIVEDIIDTYVAPNTNITKGTIAATGFTADSLEFNTSALNAIQTCADIVGTREWFVNASRQFNFIARSSTVGFRFPLAGKVLNFSNDNSSQDIATRIIVIGGDVSGTTFSRVVDDTVGQLKWGRVDKVISNSAVVSNDVADQLAEAAFAEFRDVVRRARLELLDEQRIEIAVPIPLVVVQTDRTKFGEKKFGMFLFAGEFSYQVNQISYRLNDEGTMTINMQLGQLRPSIAESIAQIEFELDQLRSVNV